LPGPFPYGFVRAIALAWPFASESSFRVAISTLAETRPGVLNGPSDRLATAMIDYLRPRARGLSLEVLRQVQEAVWFAEGRQAPGSLTVPLVTLLVRAATELLQFEGGRAVLRLDRLGQHETTSRWRWLSLALPPDLLIAALAAAVRQEPSTDYVTVIPAHLWPLLDELRLANTHLHFGASVPFDVLWTNLLSRAGADPHDHPGLDRGGPAPLGGGHVFLSWLTAGAVARAVLAGYLWQWEAIRPRDRDDYATYAGRVAARSADPALTMRTLSALGRGVKNPPSYTRTRPLLRALAPSRPLEVRSNPRDAVARADPISRWLGPGAALPETRFLAHALGRLLEQPSDERFTRIFWQYVRLRGIVYRYVVQEPGTSGLDWFTTHYNRMTTLRGHLANAVMATALELESRTGRLESLEVRTSPEDRWAATRQLVEQVAWAPSPPRANPERGLVLHFLKQRPEGRVDHADPRQPAHGCRHGAYYSRRLIETMAIERALRFHPQLLVVLRGIDVCALELAQPTWVFLPLIARLRASSLVASAALARHGRIPPFRVTMHAGEDFRTLAEGLRRIHEPIEFGAVQSGDRLGHAIALGLLPARWVEYSGPVPQPAIERLDDLLWEMARYRAGDLPAEADRAEWIRGEIERLSRFVYGRPCVLEDLLRARELRHMPAVLRRVGYPFMRGLRPPAQEDKALTLLWEYLTSARVYMRGNIPIAVTSHKGEIAMLHEAQRFLRGRIAAMAIAVEANPSSNMLIGDFHLEDHPAFRLYPLPGDSAPDGATVPVVLGDDDPLVFATTLADEFGHLYFSLVARGASSSDARQWLEGIAENAMLARFTLPESVLPAGVRRRTARLRYRMLT
jgi:hypothetical protein